MHKIHKELLVQHEEEETGKLDLNKAASTSCTPDTRENMEATKKGVPKSSTLPFGFEGRRNQLTYTNEANLEASSSRTVSRTAIVEGKKVVTYAEVVKEKPKRNLVDLTKLPVPSLGGETPSIKISASMVQKEVETSISKPSSENGNAGASGIGIDHEPEMEPEVVVNSDGEHQTEDNPGGFEGSRAVIVYADTEVRNELELNAHPCIETQIREEVGNELTLENQRKEVEHEEINKATMSWADRVEKEGLEAEMHNKITVEPDGTLCIALPYAEVIPSPQVRVMQEASFIATRLETSHCLKKFLPPKGKNEKKVSSGGQPVTRARVSTLIHNGNWALPIQLQQLLSNAVSWQNLQDLDTNEQDNMVWTPNHCGKFSMHSAFEEIRRKRPKPCWVSMVWRSYVPIKMAAIAWKLCNNCAVTDKSLMNKGLKLVSRCYMCGEEEETLKHLLWGCSFTITMWNWISE
ncbi:hypothetical protein IFM89_017116 [Coptis chinensis]|uniref:Reverse transcriptase zinc-binding domain-containing protein n=1 Tax=Coptis chinensis TaxID=261450 RepID=A0A835HQB5_9MAGN|nr:hypothetical protein IFM89_017116 [Coptis chinensis]